MKNSWGKGIVISLVAFVVVVAVMVLIAFIQKTDLVANNYYENELKYQDQIDMMKNTASLKEKVTVSQAGNSLAIRFPGSIDFSNVMGIVKFYHPSDAVNDFSLPLKLDSDGLMAINWEKISKGLWKVKLNWSLKDKKYFSEVSIIIQ